MTGRDRMSSGRRADRRCGRSACLEPKTSAFLGSDFHFGHGNRRKTIRLHPQTPGAGADAMVALRSIYRTTGALEAFWASRQQAA
jgi:hypothetical protein